MKNIVRKMKKMILSLCCVIGGIVIISSLGFCIFKISHSGNKIENHSVLVVDFSETYREVPVSGIVDEIFDRKETSLFSLIQAIEYAATDDRIQGIVAKINTSNLDFAQIQDVAHAIELFKSSGKKTYVFSQGFGPFGQGNKEYYLASFFDEIYMQPHTYLGLTGISIEMPFIRQLLDKFGISPQFYSRYEYKSAMMSFTDNKIPEEVRSNMHDLADSLVNVMLTDIAQNRKIDQDVLRKYMNNAPIKSTDAEKYGLITGELYWNEVKEALALKKVKNYVDVNDYASLITYNRGDMPAIALLNLSGVIHDGEDTSDIDGEASISSREVAKYLDEIGKIDNLKALIIRINSPGGSYNAADDIYQSLLAFKQKTNAVVIISQSGYAASGGYFVSLAGDYIVSEPATITGSIGVLGGKFVLADFWKKFNVHWAKIQIGDHADILSMNTSFSPQELAIFNQSLDEVYADFTAKVVEKRKLHQDINTIARGRVWTGDQALKLGLVDETGGYDKAFEKAISLSHIGKNEKFALHVYPKSKSFSEKLREIIFQNNVSMLKLKDISTVDMSYLKLLNRLQYDTVLIPFNLNM